jgi:hypothetical protein
MVEEEALNFQKKVVTSRGNLDATADLQLEHLPTPSRTLEFPILKSLFLPKYGDIRDKFLCCLDRLER